VAYGGAMTMLVEYYPNPSYWSDLLGVMQANPEFSDQLALDFFRLKLATGVAVTAPEYMDMTQAALQAGLTNEAAKIIDQGFSSGILGTGAEAARETRLKALVVTRQEAASAIMAIQSNTAAAAGDEASLFTIGFNQVDAGNPAGLGLMAAAIRSGKLLRPGPAELEIGIAYREAGQEPNAKAVWRGVQGGDGAADLSKLWSYVR
jgi:DNA topoisomerase VI subunit B